MSYKKAIATFLLPVMLSSCGAAPSPVGEATQAKIAAVESEQIRFEAYDPEAVYREVRFNQRLGFAMDVVRRQAMPLPVTEARPNPNAVYVTLYSVADTNNDRLIDAVNFMAFSPSTRQQRIVSVRMTPRQVQALRHYNWQATPQAMQAFNQQTVAHLNRRLAAMQRPPHAEAYVDWGCAFFKAGWEGVVAAASCEYWVGSKHPILFAGCLIVGFGATIYSVITQCVR